MPNDSGRSCAHADRTPARAIATRVTRCECPARGSPGDDRPRAALMAAAAVLATPALVATQLTIPPLPRGIVPRPRLRAALERGADGPADARLRPGGQREDDPALVDVRRAPGHCRLGLAGGGRRPPGAAGRGDPRGARAHRAPRRRVRLRRSLVDAARARARPGRAGARRRARPARARLPGATGRARRAPAAAPAARPGQPLGPGASPAPPAPARLADRDPRARSRLPRARGQRAAARARAGARRRARGDALPAHRRLGGRPAARRARASSANRIRSASSPSSPATIASSPTTCSPRCCSGERPRRRRFLLQTAIADRLCGDLADAITGEQDGSATLEALERDNGFVVALDSQRRWYRMHRLFGELLRVHARRELGDELGELHRRAALWYAAAGEPADALRHAAAGADWDLTADLVATHWLELSARSGREVAARDPGAGAAGAPRRRPPHRGRAGLPRARGR